MTRACLSLLAGMYALQLSSFTVASDLDLVAFAASVALFAIRRARLLACFLAGAALFGAAANDVVDSRLSPVVEGDSILCRVRIVEFPRDDGVSTNFVAEPLNDRRLPRRTRISWFEPPVKLHLGDVWRFELRLRRPRSTKNPGAFDFEAWLFREQIGAVGYVVGSHRNHLLESGAATMTQKLRQRVANRISNLVAESEHAAVLVAIVVGARHLVSQEQWDRYARTGTSHLMAISGLHIGLAAGGGYVLAAALCGLAGGRVNQHLVAVFVSLIVAALYTLVSGFAVPARRASLMIALAGIAVSRQRQPRPLVIVSAACVLIAATGPLATMAPGFKLSFAAVAVLLWLARRYRRIPSSSCGRVKRCLYAVGELCTMQLMLLLGLLPITVLVFGRIAFAALPVNLLVVPLFSLVTVPLALFGVLLDGPLRMVGDPALILAARSIGLIEHVIAAVAASSWAATAVPAIAGLAWMYIVLSVVWVVAPPGWPGRHIVWLSVAAIVFYTPREPAADCAEINVLDVGQGLATVVETRKHVLLFDTGVTFRGGGSIAESVVLPYLANRDIEQIDRLVVSHADLDHAGGVQAVISNLEVGQIVSGEPLPGRKLTSRPCVAGEQWSRDGVRFRFLHPPATSPYEGNNASCVLQVSVGSHRILLTGDIERPVENLLVQTGAVEAVDVVVVPHHGSRTSSSQTFVRALEPSVAVISAGFGNRWGFPKDDVVARWQAVGAKVLVTATSGAISLRMCARSDHVVVSEYRREQRRIWHE